MDTLRSDQRSLYSSAYYRLEKESSFRAASKIVPIACSLIKPKSVVDVGCGAGSWLLVFQQNGVLDILGIDAPWLDKKVLQIPSDKFLEADLTKPIERERKFDLVVSLEVAEHLPPQVSDSFVGSLTSLGQVILFSAAIPHQGGTNHQNEQWPDYWARKFEAAGYMAVDCIREKIWSDSSIDAFYRQNILLFVDSRRISDYPPLLTSASPLSIVHPEIWSTRINALENAFNPRNVPARVAIRALPFAAAKLARRALRKVRSASTES